MLAKEHIALIIAIVDRADGICKAPARNHGAGQTCRLLDIGCCTGGDIVVTEFQFLRHAATHHDGQTRGHLDLGHGQLVVFRQLHNHAECASARDDRRLVDRICRRHFQRHNGVARLVPGGEFLFLFGHDHGAAFRPHQHLVLGVFEFLHGDHALAATGRKQGSLVHEVRQVSAREAGRAARNGLRVDILCQRNITHVNAKDFLAAHNVRIADGHLTVETART